MQKIKKTLNKLESFLPNGKITKICAWILSITFIGIVLLERVPGVMTPTINPYESLMFNLFKISLLDDVTHGLSGIAGLFAIYKGRKAIVKWLMWIGGYYSLDAIFATIASILMGESVVSWFSLNFPHYMITILCLTGLYFGVKNIEVK
jgi:hypothetical protein